MDPSERLTAAQEPLADEAEADGRRLLWLRRFLGQRERGWHLPFALKIGVAISAMALLAAILLAYLGVSQNWKLLEQQSEAFGQTIVE